MRITPNDMGIIFSNDKPVVVCLDVCGVAQKYISNTTSQRLEIVTNILNEEIKEMENGYNRDDLESARSLIADVILRKE